MQIFLFISYSWIFVADPSEKEQLWYAICSEYIHVVSNAQYGKGTKQAKEWVEANFTPLFQKYIGENREKNFVNSSVKKFGQEIADELT